jgi:hypothetical protein
VRITLLDLSTSFYLPSRFRHLPVRLLLATVLASTAPGGCRRGIPGADAPGPSPARERLRAGLALVPSEARIVVGIDLERLRASPPGRELLLGVGQRAARLFDDVAQGTGIDLLAQVRYALLAVPGERQPDGRSVLVAELGSFDAPRASAWLAQRHDPTTTAFLRDARWLVIAKGAWATTVPALASAHAATPSVEGDTELSRLCQRVSVDQGLWLASVVPTALRQRVSGESAFPDIASITRWHATASLAAGFHLAAVAELSNEPDARTLHHRLAAYVRAAKHHPDVLALGLAPYLEVLRLEARGPEVDATLDLPPAQIGDVVGRIEDLLRGGPAAIPARP